MTSRRRAYIHGSAAASRRKIRAARRDRRDTIRGRNARDENARIVRIAEKLAVRRNRERIRGRAGILIVGLEQRAIAHPPKPDRTSSRNVTIDRVLIGIPGAANHRLVIGSKDNGSDNAGGRERADESAIRHPEDFYRVVVLIRAATAAIRGEELAVGRKDENTAARADDGAENCPIGRAEKIDPGKSNRGDQLSIGRENGSAPAGARVLPTL